MPAVRIEVVSHCYRYASLLRYQLSSLCYWPPPEGMEVTATVFFTPNDEATTRTLEWFGNQQVRGVRWNWQALPESRLCRRAIGRNLAALSSTADWVWFTDADYWFTSDCWKSFMRFGHINVNIEPLVYPKKVHTQSEHGLGDNCIARARMASGFVFADPREFTPLRMSRAIGGIQIASGGICREKGYLNGWRRAQTPLVEPIWQRTMEDVWYRKYLQTEGVPVRLLGVYRIRHSQAGRECPGLVL